MANITSNPSTCSIPTTLPSAPLRQDLCLNGLWSFQCETDATPTEIRVPGFYSILRTGKWARQYWDVFNYPDTWTEKGGVYRRTLHLPPTQAGRRQLFRCGGCSFHTRVLLNGQQIGESHDGYYPFEFDLSPAARAGENLLEVIVDARSGDTIGGESMQNRGIWKDTFLTTRSDLAVQYGAYVITFVEKSSLSFTFPVLNAAPTATQFFARHFITDAQGIVVKTIDTGPQNLAAGQTATYTTELPWSDPHLWFTHDPYLYHLHTVLYDPQGNPIDWHTLRFGFREISVRGPHLFLNGRELYLRGHGGHECGDLQAPKAYAVQWIKSLKELGVNFLRLHVYPRNQELYDAADELGFLLEAEGAFHFRASEDPLVWQDHFRRMVADQRNHPSVFLWSVSNEFRWNGGGERTDMIDYVRSLDPTRPVFASDFSGWSTHGDVIAHHYNAQTVFEEWQQFGPDKPMIWDEVGNVWQPDRPLRNGTAGYEVIAQDYATGLWRDGHDDMLADLAGIRDGRVINGRLHRINAIIPWDLSYCFFRFQPINNHQTLELNSASLDTPGTKPRYIQSCASTINIWDDTLPVFEPNPGLQFFQWYLKAVRFVDQPTPHSFFADQPIQITGKLFYEDLRFADEMRCRVETPDGNCLSEHRIPCTLNPGDLIESITASFDLPHVLCATPVKLVRQFYHQNIPGDRYEIHAKLFPRMSPASLASPDANLIGIIDPTGRLAALVGPSAVAVATPAEAAAKGITLLLIAGQRDDVLPFIQAGGRTLCFCDGAAPLPDNIIPSARLLLNGPRHRILDGVGQEDFTHWQGRAITASLPIPTGPFNSRNLLAGDKNADSSALYEMPQGRGIAVYTTLRLAESFQDEPAAGWLLHNLLLYLLSYRPTLAPARTAVLAGRDLNGMLASAGLLMDDLAPTGSFNLSPYRTLILDASDPSLSATLADPRFVAAISGFAQQGGQVLAYQTTPESLPALRKLTGADLALTEPYLLETGQCVKAAISWTRRDTPADAVEYYDGICIPQPFEPNLDPMLCGLSNRELNWDGQTMFQTGIEIAGMDPVRACPEYNILISNWRNDWSQPLWGGEYIQEAKDIRRADWFINRDPVLLRVQHGQGSWLLCQLDLVHGGDKALHILRHLLTGMGCSLGVATAFPPESATFDLSRIEHQWQRFARPTNNRPARRRVYGVGQAEQIVGADGNSLPNVLLIGDACARGYSPAAKKSLAGWARVVGADENGALGTPHSRDTVKNIFALTSSSRWQVIHFNVGLEDLKRWAKVGDGMRPYLDASFAPMVPPDEFERNLREIVKALKKTGAKLYWGAITPIPAKAPGFRTGDEVAYNRIARKIMDENGVYVNDLYGFVQTTWPDYAQGDTFTFTEEQDRKLGELVASAIRYFGE